MKLAREQRWIFSHGLNQSIELLFYSTFLDLSTIYVLREKPWIVSCSAQNPANITWRLASGREYKLNVTQVTDRKSVLYARNSEEKGALLLDGPLQCRARDLTTMQETLIDQFEFMIGSTRLYMSLL